MSILTNFLDAIKPNKTVETIEDTKQEEKQEEVVEEKETETIEETTDEEEQEVTVEVAEEQEEVIEESKELTVEDIPEDLLKQLFEKFEEAKLTDEEKQEKVINDKLTQSLKTYSTLEVKNALSQAQLPSECMELFDSNRYINGQAVDTDKLKADVENIKTIINKITDLKVEQVKKELFADKEPLVTTKPVRAGSNKDFDSAFNNLFNSLNN